MSDNFRRTVLITGASSGIGKVTSLYLCEKGYKVIGSSRKLGKLDAITEKANEAGECFFPLELDINLAMEKKVLLRKFCPS